MGSVRGFGERMRGESRARGTGLPSTSPAMRGPVVSFGRFKVTPHYRAAVTGSGRDQKVSVSKEECVTSSKAPSRLGSKQPRHPSVLCPVREGSSVRRQQARGSGPGGAGELGVVNARGARWGCTQPPPPGNHAVHRGRIRGRTECTAPRWHASVFL